MHLEAVQDQVQSELDLVIDTVGNLSIAQGKRLLSDRGKLLLVAAGLADTIRARGNVVAGAAPERVEDFDFLLQRVADGELEVVVDQVYELDAIVDAHRRVDRLTPDLAATAPLRRAGLTRGQRPRAR